MSVTFAVLLGFALAAQAAAGTFFRLEIGSPIAAGTDTRMKDKKTVLVVRPLLCADEASVVVTGTAEGFVNGVRQSVPLRLVSLPTPGVHAVPLQWPDGQWVLHLKGTCPATKAVTSAIVPVTKSGFLRDKTEVFPATATTAQVEAALAAHRLSQS